MLVLAFDTTSEAGGVGIYRDFDCLAKTANQGPANYYSVTLFQMVDRILSQANLALRDIELFAVANGPGSFTGIRVGLAAAQAWAKAFNRPVRGVSVLEAMVEEARPEADWAVPILDARRGEYFLGFFRRPPRRPGCDPDAFVAEGERLVLKPNALAPFLEQFLCREQPRATVTCVTREQDRMTEALRGGLPKSLGWKSIQGTLVAAIARLAVEAYRQGRLQSPAQLEACYIRRSDAELNWRE